MLWSRNTQLHYPFQNTALDYSSYARHGTVNGSGVYATKPNAGRCLYFDGVGDYVSTPSFGLTGTVVVFAAWLRLKPHATIIQAILADGFPGSSTVGFLRIFRNSIEWGTNGLLFTYANGIAQAYAGDGSFFLGYSDVWTHAAFVCDYAGKKTYTFRNAIHTATSNMSGTPVFPTTNQAKVVGTWGGPADIITDGYLQEVYLGTRLTCPPVAVLTANANRLMLGMNPIW